MVIRNILLKMILFTKKQKKQLFLFTNLLQTAMNTKKIIPDRYSPQHGYRHALIHIYPE